MALLRCPSCNSKGEVLGNAPQGRYRCAQCGHSFDASEARMTHEYNILAEDSPAFLPEAPSEGLDHLIEPNWQGWVKRLAHFQGIEERKLVHQALVEFAKRQGFAEPPPHP